MSSPSERYVPVHKRSRSSVSVPSSSPIVTYSRDELLGLAPSSSSSLEHHYVVQQPHQGWVNLHEAMRTYLRLSSPELLMNRKTRKTLDYQQSQHRTSGAQSPISLRSPSPSSSSSSTDDSQTSRHLHIKPAPVDVPTPSFPKPGFKRVTPGRPRRASNARARHTNFTAFHKHLVGGPTDNQWRNIAVAGH